MMIQKIAAHSQLHRDEAVKMSANKKSMIQEDDHIRSGGMNISTSSFNTYANNEEEMLTDCHRVRAELGTRTSSCNPIHYYVDL